MTERAMPLPLVKGIWEHDWDPYPTIIRVSMSDGRVVNYCRDIKQPAPKFGKALDRFDRTCQRRKTRMERRAEREK